METTVTKLLTLPSAMPTALRTIKSLALLLAVIAATALGAPTAHATTYLQTFVSNIGSSNSQCSVTSPCQTFAQALAVTSSGGEINCLNPGNFGAVTISISVTINCEGVSNGGIQVGSGGVAIDVIETGIVVNLFGLDIDGENADGGTGVNIPAAATVNIRKCKIYGFAQTGNGILLQSSTSGGILVVDSVFIVNNATGIDLTSTTGVSNMTVRNSSINNNENNGIYVAMNGGTHAGVTIEQTTLAFNTAYGLAVYGAGAVAVIGGSAVVNNATGVHTLNGGIVYSFKNNQIGGNNHDGTPLTAYPGGPLN